MAEGERVDGRRLAAESAAILAGVLDELLGLAGKVDAREISVWQRKIEALVDDLATIKEKLFLKTRDGTSLAQLALEKVKALDEAVKQGARELPDADATLAVEKAMEEMTEGLNALIEKTKTQVIRMT